MDTQTLEELRHKRLLTDEQFVALHRIATKRTFSVHYELQGLMYLAVLLLTSGLGVLLYRHAGELKHTVLMAALGLGSLASLGYAFRHGAAYHHGRTEKAVPYLDHIALLGAVLFASLLGYLLYRYPALQHFVGSTTLVTSMWFFFLAYRLDHLGLLALAITALASFFGIQIYQQLSPASSIGAGLRMGGASTTLGAMLAGAGYALDRQGIKRHFSFTYFNYASLLFLAGSLALTFEHRMWFVLLAAGCAAAFAVAHWTKRFVFLVYAFVFGYVGFSYAIVAWAIDNPLFWSLYLIASCGVCVKWTLRYRHYFQREP